MLRRLTPSSDLPDIEGWTIVRGTAGAAERVPVRTIWSDDSSTLSLVTDPGSPEAPTFIVRYEDVAEFKLSFATHEISIAVLDDVADTTISHLLVDQIWPRILAHRGQLVLHAAGVAVPGGAILFVGQSGRGKSTLAASLHQRGFLLLGDDAMIIPKGGDARCSAVYRSLRLFPDSIETLFEPSVGRSEVADYTDKENVHLPEQGHRSDSHRIRAIFLISPDEAAPSASLAALAPSDACMRLVEHSFWLDPTDIVLTARKLEAASALANRVPAYQLAYPRDYAKLGELHIAIFSVLD